MKLFKRISAMMLAVIMTVMTLGTTTAFAAEPVTEDAVWVTSEEIEVVDNNELAPQSAVVTVLNQSFSMSGTHTGSTRTYNYNNIGFNCSFTNQNGNTPSDGTVLAVRLYNASTGALVNEWQGSNGYVAAPAFSINYGGRYYFKYLVAYGTQNLKINMWIFTIP